MSVLEKDDGFTLLETTIALTIFLVAMGALYPVFSSTHNRLEISNQRAIGISLASSKVEEFLVLKDWTNYPKQGEDNGWSWEATAEAVSHETDGPTALGSLIELKVTASKTLSHSGAPVTLKRIVWVP